LFSCEGALIETLTMPAKRGVPAAESQDSQSSLCELMAKQRLDSGSSSGSPEIMPPTPIKISVCIFKDVKNDEIFAPQNSMFAYTAENEVEVKKKLRSIRTTAILQGITHEIITVDATTILPPTVVGGLSARYVYKGFKDNANGWGIKRKKKQK